VPGGISWYELDATVARICTNQARIYSVNQGLYAASTLVDQAVGFGGLHKPTYSYVLVHHGGSGRIRGASGGVNDCIKLILKTLWVVGKVKG